MISQINRYLPADSSAPTFMIRLIACCMLIGSLALLPAFGQEGSSIPKDFRGEDASIARGLLTGNLIESNFRNQGEVARVGDTPWSNWPRGVGNRHIDGIVPLAIGSVRGRRAEYPEFYPGKPDTILHPVIVNIKDFGRKIVDDTTWGWLPLPGFFNELRRDPITGLRNPTPALSDDPASWPEFWPIANPSDRSPYPARPARSIRPRIACRTPEVGFVKL